MTNPADVPIFVLCGGLGTRLKEHTELVPKPMVPVGSKPILWHIMQTYAHHGFKRFVLCLGYKADVIKSYFINYTSINSDCVVSLKTNDVLINSIDHSQDWEVTLTDTGERAMTGARIARAADRFMGDAEIFGVTYGDGVTNANLGEEFSGHCKHGRLGTVLGVNPPSRFGRILSDGDTVTRFDEKPAFVDDWINGGYFFFRKTFLSYLSTEDNCILERVPLVRLAEDRQLNMFRHRGFWACMDTQRDLDDLNKMWESGTAPWAVWEGSDGEANKTETKLS